MTPAATRAYEMLYGEAFVRIFFVDSFIATSSDVNPFTSKHEIPAETCGSTGVCNDTPDIFPASSRNAAFNSRIRDAIRSRPIDRCKSTAAGSARIFSNARNPPGETKEAFVAGNGFRFIHASQGSGASGSNVGIVGRNSGHTSARPHRKPVPRGPN